MKYLFAAAFLLFAGSASAQLADSIKAQFIKDWQRAKTYTNEYLDAMPANKYNFRAQDSTRTFAEQMLHLAQGTVGLIANGTGAQRIWVGQNVEQRKSAHTADSVKYLVNASYDYAIESINKMDLTKLLETSGRGNFAATRYAWIGKAFEHQGHHRGQTTIYIRLLGIKPPNEKLF